MTFNIYNLLTLSGWLFNIILHTSNEHSVCILIMSLVILFYEGRCSELFLILSDNIFGKVYDI